PYPEGRYDTPAAIRADLERVLTGETTEAEQQGWPEAPADEPPTRRVRDGVDDEPPTRRVTGSSSSNTTIPAGGSPKAAPAPSAAPLSRAGRWPRVARVIRVLVPVLNEACVRNEASRVASTVPLQDFAGLTNAWSAYDALHGR